MITRLILLLLLKDLKENAVTGVIWTLALTSWYLLAYMDSRGVGFRNDHH